MPRVALEIEFDGARFAGSQMQSGLRTLQGELTTIIGELVGAAVVVRPASRLDQGVSAEAIPVDVVVPALPGTGVPVAEGVRNLGLALAAELPADISVRRVALVPDSWHAQHNAVGKAYRYRVLLRGTKPALDTRGWWLRRIDHPERLQTLADQLVGTRDLRLFACLRHDGTDENDGARTISVADWQREGDALVLRIAGSGFLYKQIRGFVGAMVHVAQARRTPEEFAALVAGDPTVKRMGNLAPPGGLVLERVVYDPEPAWVVV